MMGSKLIRLVLGLFFFSLGIYAFIVDGFLVVVLGLISIVYGIIFLLTLTNQFDRIKRIMGQSTTITSS